MSAPAVSFIVPLFNCLPCTQTMLASLRATVPAGLDHEIILIDDGSTDGTREWLQGLEAVAGVAAPGGPGLHRETDATSPTEPSLGLARDAGVSDPGYKQPKRRIEVFPGPLTVILNPENLGFAKSNNRAAAAAKGRLLVLLNNDLVLRPGWLQPMLVLHGKLDAAGRAGVIGNVQYRVADGSVDHTGIVINAKAKPEHRHRAKLIERLRGYTNPPAVTGACLLIAADLWRTLGGFDERYFNGCEDVDLCFQAAEIGRTNAVALHSRVDHHVSASPNRKVRDELNAHRLARRWSDRLARLAEMAWTKDYFERHLSEPRNYPDRRLARQAALCRFGIRRRPPRRAAEGARAALAIEFARWQALERAASSPCP